MPYYESRTGFKQFFRCKGCFERCYICKTNKNGKTQEGIINAALKELNEAEFEKTDILYMQSMGINPPFESGSEAVEYLKKQNIPIQYGKFSDKKFMPALEETKKESLPF